MTNRCRHKGCTASIKDHNRSGLCQAHSTKANVRKQLQATPEKRVVLAGVDEGSNANGSHVAKQVSVAREPWL